MLSNVPKQPYGENLCVRKVLLAILQSLPEVGKGSALNDNALPRFAIISYNSGQVV